METLVTENHSFWDMISSGQNMPMFRWMALKVWTKNLRKICMDFIRRCLIVGIRVSPVWPLFPMRINSYGSRDIRH